MKYFHYKTTFHILLAFLILLSPLRSASASQPTSGSGGFPDFHDRSGYTFNSILIKQTVTLWADGRGDVILERTLQDVDITNWTNTTWYFDWSPGSYSQIRAWDDSGPLTKTTSQSGTRIYITVNFRRPYQPGESYHFFLAITIANMASVSGNAGQAYWYTAPGSYVQQFIQGITFPSNSTFQSISPAPTKQNGSYLEWKYADLPSTWQDTIDVTYTMSSTINISLLKQTDSPWGGQPYGRYLDSNSNHSIAALGCLLTSFAMIINYWGQRSQSQFSTDPGKLNDYLRSNDFHGYTIGSGVIWQPVLNYANANNVILTNPSPHSLGERSSYTDSILDSFLQSGNPVILGVNKTCCDDHGNYYAGHFVVATGKVTVNGIVTYAINDPYYGPILKTTLRDWGDTYFSATLLSGTPSAQQSLTISAHSPVKLLITDPLGRRIGYQLDGTFVNEIPSSDYGAQAILAYAVGPDHTPFSQVVNIYEPLDGAYQVMVVGTGSDDYTIETEASNWSGSVNRQIITGSASLGSVDYQTIVYNSFVGIGHYTYLPLILR